MGLHQAPISVACDHTTVHLAIACLIVVGVPSAQLDLLGDDHVSLDESSETRSFKFQDFGHVVSHDDVPTGSAQPGHGHSSFPQCHSLCLRVPARKD